MNVLLVEDDVVLLESTADALRRGGHTVATALDGEAALLRWEAEHPDLVLLDASLPKLDSWEVCGRIRREDSQVPIIVLVSRWEDPTRALDAGANDYLTKPFSARALLARIRPCLRRVRLPVAADH